MRYVGGLVCDAYSTCYDYHILESPPLKARHKHIIQAHASHPLNLQFPPAKPHISQLQHFILLGNEQDEGEHGGVGEGRGQGCTFHALVLVDHEVPAGGEVH